VITRYSPELQILLQQRSQHKYHSGGLWTNTCCSHPRPGENLHEAALRRLKEEMGISTTSLQYQGYFYYQAQCNQTLVEHEVDHVFVGEMKGDILINREEVSDYQWINYKEIFSKIALFPHQFTPWLKQAIEVAIPI
jgi:isopentenyl-diphosphate delta-isomerase